MNISRTSHLHIMTTSYEKSINHIIEMYKKIKKNVYLADLAWHSDVDDYDCDVDLDWDRLDCCCSSVYQHSVLM